MFKLSNSVKQLSSFKRLSSFISKKEHEFIEADLYRLNQPAVIDYYLKYGTLSRSLEEFYTYRAIIDKIKLWASEEAVKRSSGLTLKNDVYYTWYKVAEKYNINIETMIDSELLKLKRNLIESEIRTKAEQNAEKIISSIKY